MFKIVILIFVVVAGWLLLMVVSIEVLTNEAGWVVLSGHTRIKDPHVNFRNAFAGSSHSSNDVSGSLAVYPPPRLTVFIV